MLLKRARWFEDHMHATEKGKMLLEESRLADDTAWQVSGFAAYTGGACELWSGLPTVRGDTVAHVRQGSKRQRSVWCTCRQRCVLFAYPKDSLTLHSWARCCLAGCGLA